MGGGIPTLKSKGGAVPEEVTNAIETNGMGWTDEDETVHQIDEKYIPSSGGGISAYYFEFDRASFEVETDANVIEVMSKIKNKEVVIFIVKDYDSNHPEWDSVSIYQVGTITINTLDDYIMAYLAENFILAGGVVDGEPVWQIESQSSE